MQPQVCTRDINHNFGRTFEETTQDLSKGERQLDPKQMIFHQESGVIFLPDVMPDDEKVAVFYALVDWIVDDKQAFCVVENSKFQKFVSRLNNLYRLTSRCTVVRGLEDRYEVALRNFCNIFADIPGRVALICDGWSSRVMRGYFVMTLHWIDNQ